MSTEIIFNAYLATQAALLISWLGFLAVKKAFSGTGNVTWLRVAQILLFVSLTFPAATFFHQTKVNYRDFPALGKSYGRKVIFTAPPVLRIQTAAVLRESHPVSPLPAKYLPSQMTCNDLLFLLLIAFGMGVFVRKTRQMAVILRVLKASTVLHAVGKIKIVVSSEIVVPFAMTTLRKTWVALPLQIFGNPQDFKVAMAHELQHVRQGDPLFALGIDFLTCLFGPGLKLWKSEIIELQELSCDEALIGRKKVSMHDYGSCLLRVAEAALGRGSLYVGTTCMAHDPRNPKSFKSFLRRRIEMFTEYKEVRPSGLCRKIVGTAVILVCGTMALAAGSALKPSQIAPINPG